MFDLVVWDSPMGLVMELALSVAFVAGIVFVVRLVNARSASPPPDTSDTSGQPLERDE